MSNTPARAASVQEPEQINERFREAFNARQLAALLALYEPEAVLVPTADAPAVQGRTAIAAALRALLALGGTLTFVRHHCSSHGDIALLSIDWTIEGAAMEGRTVNLHGRSSEVVRQPSGEWQYVIDHPFAGSEVTAPLPTPIAAGLQY